MLILIREAEAAGFVIAVIIYGKGYYMEEGLN